MNGGDSIPRGSVAGSARPCPGRRDVLAGLAATVAAAPAVVSAQAGPPLLAILEPGPQQNVGSQAFVERLRELGWTEGRLRLDIRFGDWSPERMRQNATAAVATSPRLIFTHSIPGLRAAMAATSSAPIVALTADMIAEGFVASLARPGGNVTGVTLMQRELDLKRLELLHEARPAMRRVGFLSSPATPLERVAALGQAAGSLGLVLETGVVERAERIEQVVDELAARGVEGLLMQNSAALSLESGRVAASALRRRLPAVSEAPLFAQRGGLIQYGADVPAMFHQLAAQADKLLRGARPADIPVEQPAAIELVVNQRTADSLGIVLPASLLARADEVIR